MKDKWYFQPYVLVIAFLSVGPFALPLVWRNPRFSRRSKTLISIAIIVLSYLLGVVLVKSVKSIYEYYNLMFQDLY